MGILAAVVERQQTGERQFVDISMTDAAFALCAMSGTACLSGRSRCRDGAAEWWAFYDYYRTWDNRWLSIGSLEPQCSARLCDTLGLGEIKDFALSQNPEHQQKLKAALKEKILDKTFAE